MSERLIPNGHQDFLTKAETFVHTISSDPQRFAMSSDDLQAITDACARFREAYQNSKFGGRSEAATRVMKAARAQTVTLYKRFIERIRVSETVDSEARFLVGLRARAGKKCPRLCPQEPPYLRFVQAMHVGSGALPMHELAFRAALGSSQIKPDGAVRLELFVDLVPPGEAVPPHPGANHGGRPWYLRSYTRSPIKLAPPICRVPMLIVYWGRWADSTGNVGPFSATVVSRIEGWTPQMNSALQLPSRKRVSILEDPTTEGIPGPGQRYTIAVLEAQYQSFHPPQIEAVAPRQLQGPAESKTEAA